MKGFLILLVVALAQYALGNAKVLNNAVLLSERVNVAIKDDTATVTGTFRFLQATRFTKDVTEREGVYFPLVGPKGKKWNVGDFKFELELNGTKATSYVIASNAPVAVTNSEAYSVVWILASFPEQPLRNWRLQVFYQQNLLEGKFYYLPILERTRPSAEGYEIHIQADRPVRSVGKGAGGVMVKGARELVFAPVHLGMLVVEADSGNKAHPGREKSASP
jgi:hypothetical protein